MDENYTDFLEKEEVRIRASIAAYIRKSLSCSTSEVINSNTFSELKKSLAEKIREMADTEEFRMTIYNEVNNKLEEIEKNGTSFKDILPEGFENNLKVYLYNNSPEIIAQMKKYLSNKDTEKKIKKEINKLGASVNPMLAKFINADSLYVKLMQGTDSYFNDPQNTMKLLDSASKLIDNGMEKEIKSVSMYFPYEGRKSMINTVRDGLINTLFQQQAVEAFLSYFEECLQGYENIYSWMNSFIPDLEDQIQKEAKEMFDYIKAN